MRSTLVLFPALLLLFAAIPGGESRCQPGSERMRGCAYCRCLPDERESCVPTEACRHTRARPGDRACSPGHVLNTKCRKCVCQADGKYQCQKVCNFEIQRDPTSTNTKFELDDRLGDFKNDERLWEQKEILFVP